MQILRFRTNIFDKSQIEEVAPFLDDENSIRRWKIDTEDPENTLTIYGRDLDPEIIEILIRECGYEAEMSEVLALGGSDL